MIVDEDSLGTAIAEDGIVTTFDDCDDTNPSGTIIAEDGDCDGVLTADDCNDEDNTSTVVSEDGCCDGVLTQVAMTECHKFCDCRGWRTVMELSLIL